jgi:heme-degrading monooxygenase HmoA
MSVLMTLRVDGDARAVEKLAADDPKIFGDILEKAKPHGLISHAFYGNDNEILVVDEWRDEESFQAFFQEAGEQIQKMMGHAGVSTEPTITFWRKLETGEDVG